MRLQLFGSPALHTGNGAVPLAWQRPTALLAMVAMQASGLAREALATLLLPDAPATAARQNLRRLLHRARAVLPDPAWLQADEQSLRWVGACDVVDFQAAIDAGDWARAVALQGAPLLAGCGSLGLAAIDDWLDSERARLQARLKLALTARLAQGTADDDDRARCIARLFDLDPLDEQALQAALLAVCGPASRAAAAAACDAGLRQLREQLGLAPTPRTLALLAQVMQGAVPPGASGTGPPPEAAAPAPLAERPRRGFAWVDGAAPLLGREAEMGALLKHLVEGPGRLFTLVGLGGIGKTRLALVAADAWAAQTQGRVVGLELATLAPGEDLASALALAAGLAPEGNAAPLAEWLARTAEAQPLLLLLDNFEHLLVDDAARARVGEWIDAAPSLRVLVTSREALGLAAEFRIEVQGLGTAHGAPACAALFVHHARRLGAPPRPAEAGAIAAIARRLHGHPLGLELAASWSPLMSAAEILAEIDRGLAFLADEDVAQIGQRSLRAVFAHSWRLLPAGTQRVLAALCVFEASFDVEAARAVTDAALADLLRLAAKSLLQRVAAGRFVLHPLVRQFALRELPPPRRQVLQLRLAEHCARRVAALPGLGLGQVDAAALAWLNDESRNLVSAWQQAVAAARFDLVAALHDRLADFMMAEHRAGAMIELWAAAEAAVPAADPLRQRLAVARAGALVTVGRIAEAETLLDGVDARLDTPALRSEAATARAVVAHWRGDAAQAAHQVELAQQQAEAADHPLLLVRALGNSVVQRWMQGRHAEAEPLARRMLALAQTHGANLFVARAERMLAVALDELGRLDEAGRWLAAALAHFEALGDAGELVFTLVNASHFARKRGQPAAQLQHAERARALADRFGLHGRGLSALEVHGTALAAVGRRDEAEATLCCLLRRALKAGRAPTLLRSLATLAVVQAGRDAAGEPAADTLAALAWLQRRADLPGSLRDSVGQALAAAVPDASRRQALIDAQAGVTPPAIAERLLAACIGPP